MDPSPAGPSSAGSPADPAARRRVRVVAAVVLREGRLLLTRRPPGGPLGRLWELPGGKLEPGESPQEALVRELREELGVGATAHEVMDVATHDYPHGAAVEVVFVRAEIDSTAFTFSSAVHAARWLAPREIDLDTVLAGDRAFLAGLAAGRG